MIKVVMVNMLLVVMYVLIGITVDLFTDSGALFAFYGYLFATFTMAINLKLFEAKR